MSGTTVGNVLQPPPRLTGNVGQDVVILSSYLSDLYRALALEANVTGSQEALNARLTAAEGAIDAAEADIAANEAALGGKVNRAGDTMQGPLYALQGFIANGGATLPLSNNLEWSAAWQSNTTLRFRLRGDDGVVRALDLTPGGGAGNLLAANNLSDLASAGAALTNLGGTATGTAIFTATDAAAARTALDFSEAVDDRVATLLQAGTNITLTYNDIADTLTIAAAGGGGGGGTSWFPGGW